MKNESFDEILLRLKRHRSWLEKRLEINWERFGYLGLSLSLALQLKKVEILEDLYRELKNARSEPHEKGK